TSTVYSRPCHCSFVPALRSEASSVSRSTGNSRSASTCSIVRPTAPVAPRIATFICLLPLSGRGGGTRARADHVQGESIVQRPYSVLLPGRFDQHRDGDSRRRHGIDVDLVL